MKPRKLLRIKADLEKYNDEYDFSILVEERLAKTLMKYIYDVDNTYMRLRTKRPETIARRLEHDN